MVCLFHVKKYIWKTESPYVFTDLCEQGFMGVYIFFVLSGFVIPYSLHVKNYRLHHFPRFLLKRTIRIEPPYIIFVLLAFAWTFGLYEWKHIGKPYLYDLRQFFLNISYLAPFLQEKWIIIIFWTLAIEFQFYILTGIVYPAMMKKAIVRYATVAAILYIGIVIPENYQTVFHVYIFFFAGFQAFLFYIKKIEWTEFTLTMVLSILFIRHFEFATAVYYTLFTLAGIFLLNYKTRITTWLGNISYSLYLTHGLAGGAFAILSAGRFTPEMRFTGAVICSLFFASCYFILVEKPFLKWSKRIKY